MFKLKDNDVILFQGDSITDGNRGRNDDLNHIHGHGYQYILASEMYADNFDKDIEIVNKGISGNRIANLYGRWKEDCLRIKPTVLSVLIGVNDIYGNFQCGNGSDPDRFKKIYRLMLDEVLEVNPDVLFVIMEPFFGTSKDDAEWDKFAKDNIAAYALASKEIAEEYNAVFVPLQDIFDEYAKKTDIFKLLWDGVHPTTGGHQLIVRRWKEYAEPRINAR